MLFLLNAQHVWKIVIALYKFAIAVEYASSATLTTTVLALTFATWIPVTQLLMSVSPAWKMETVQEQLQLAE
jgi:hypothetical protein